MERNIKIAYMLVAMRHAYFWVGIWIFYYLRFTNYAGIGILESALIITMTLGEIPTGVFADMFGKKRTLALGFLLQGIGLFFIAYAGSFTGLIIGIMIAAGGTAFYSGTVESLVYDSLKQVGKEETYNKVAANITSITLFGPAIGSVIGGFLYLISPNLPFLIHAYVYMVGFVLCFFIIEPKIDSEKFSISGFFTHTQQGLRFLFANKDIIRQTVLLLVIGSFCVIGAESMNDFLGVEFGFKPQTLALLWAGILLIAGFVSRFTIHAKKYSSELFIVFSIGIGVCVTFLVSPFLGIVLGGLSLLIRICLQGMFRNMATVMINEKTESKYRTTTLSTYNLLENIPYVFTAFFIGSLADHYSAVTVSMWLGGILLMLLFLLSVERKVKLI